MKKINFIGTLMIAVSLLIISGCGQKYGKLLEFNGGQLYYTSSVTVDEANKLGQYLISGEFFDGNEITVQLNKTGNTYEFRMVIKKGIENDQQVIQLFKQMANELSVNVFEGSQVDMHLCDDHLKTLRVIVAL